MSDIRQRVENESNAVAAVDQPGGQVNPQLPKIDTPTFPTEPSTNFQNDFNAQGNALPGQTNAQSGELTNTQIENLAKLGGSFDNVQAQRITAVVAAAPHLTPEAVVGLAGSKVADPQLEEQAQKMASVQYLKNWYQQYQAYYQYQQDQNTVATYRPGEKMTPERAWQLHNAFVGAGIAVPADVTAQQPHAPLWQQALETAVAVPAGLAATAGAKIGQQIAKGAEGFLAVPGADTSAIHAFAMGKGSNGAVNAYVQSDQNSGGPAKWVGSQIREMFDSPQHFYRYISEIQQKYGWVKAGEAAAIILAPAVIMQVAVAASGGVGEAGAGAVESGVEGAVAKAITEGVTNDLTPEEGAALQTQISDAMQTPGGFDAAMETNAELPNAAGAYARNYLRMTRGASGSAIRGGTKLVGGGVKAMGDVMRAPGLLTGELNFNAAGQTVLYPGIYDNSKNGATWAANTGRPGTVGAFLATEVGAHPGTPLYNLISGPTDFIASFVIPDPLGAYGRILGAYRGQFMWEDANEAYTHLNGFKRWVDNAAREGDAYTVLQHNPQLHTIAEELQTNMQNAHGYEERVQAILDTFKANQDAARMVTTGQLPRRSIGEMMADNLKTMDNLPGVKTINKLLDPNGRYITGIGKDMHTETGEFALMDKAAYPALEQSLRAFVNDSKVNRSMIRQAINMLYSPDATPQMVVKTVGAIYKYAFLQHLADNIGKELPELTAPEMQALSDAVSLQLDQAVGKYTGALLGDKLATMAPDAANLTFPINPNGSANYDVEMAHANSLYSGQLPKVALPLPRQLNMAVRTFLISVKKGLTSEKVAELMDAIGKDTIHSEEDVAKYSSTLNKLSEQQFRAEVFSNKVFKATDWANYALNDLYFKPLALSTGGWAIRVSSSEILLNMLRQGATATLAAHFAGSPAKDFYALSAEGKARGLIPKALNLPNKMWDATNSVIHVLTKQGRLDTTSINEISHMSAAVLGIMGGVDANIAAALGYRDMVDRAAELVTAFDGHIAPPGIQGAHQSDQIQMPMNMREAYEQGASIGGPTAEHNGLSQADTFGKVDPHDTRRWYNASMNNANFLQEQPENFMREYAQAMRTTEDPTAARNAVEQAALAHFNANPEYYSPEIWGRQKQLLSEDLTTGSPRADHARAIAIDHENTVLSKPDAQGRRFYNQSLAEDIAHHTVTNDVDKYIAKYHTGSDAIAAFRRQIPGESHISQIPTQYFNTQRTNLVDPRSAANALQRAISGAGKTAPHAIQYVSSKLFDNFLGPIVNQLSRDPSYLIDYTMEYRALQRFQESKIPQVWRDAEAFAKTGTTLHHGTTEDFSRFERGTQVDTAYEWSARRPDGARSIYMTDNPDYAREYSIDRQIASVGPDTPVPDKRVISAKVYGKTLDLRYPRDASPEAIDRWVEAHVPRDLIDRLKSETITTFNHGLAEERYNEMLRAFTEREPGAEAHPYWDTAEEEDYRELGRTEVNAYDAIFHPVNKSVFNHEGSAEIENWMHDQGYGKIIVHDQHPYKGMQVSGHSYIVNPEYVNYGRDVVGDYAKGLRGEYTGLTADQMQTMAQTRAFVKLSKYVHNPVDKLHFEDMLRLISPFYFAKNQAWRRLYRLSRENPGAAEQYIRIILGYARGISMIQNRTGSTFVGIPMTSALPRLFAPLFQQFVGGMNIPVAPIGLQANLGSAASLTPLGLEGGGTNILESSTLPSVGVLSTPVRYLETYSLRHDLLPSQARWFSSLILGPAGQSESTAESVIPNPVLRGVIYDIFGTFFNQHDSNTDSYNSRNISTWVQAINYQVSQVVKRFMDQASKQYSNPTVVKVVGVIEALKWLGDTKNANAMMAQANTQTTIMTGYEAGAEMFSPFGITMGQSTPTQSAQLQALVKQYNGDFSKAEDAYIAKYPQYFELGVAESYSPGFGDFPQTDLGEKWVTQNDNMAINYPAAAIYHMPADTRTAPFSEAARSLLISGNFRERIGQSDFYHNLLWSLGDVLYYNYYYPIEQAYYKNYSYQNYKNAQDVKTAGETLIQKYLAQQSAVSGTWQPASGVARRNASMQEFVDMSNDPKYKNDPTTIALAAITNLYNASQTEKDTLKASQGAKAADQYYYNQFAPAWIHTMNGVMKTGTLNGKPLVPGLSPAKAKALGAQLSYAVLGVFLPLVPSVNPNG